MNEHGQGEGRPIPTPVRGDGSGLGEGDGRSQPADSSARDPPGETSGEVPATLVATPVVAKSVAPTEPEPPTPTEAAQTPNEAVSTPSNLAIAPSREAKPQRKPLSRQERIPKYTRLSGNHGCIITTLFLHGLSLYIPLCHLPFLPGAAPRGCEGPGFEGSVLRRRSITAFKLPSGCERK